MSEKRNQKQPDKEIRNMKQHEHYFYEKMNKFKIVNVTFIDQPQPLMCKSRQVVIENQKSRKQ